MTDVLATTRCPQCVGLVRPGQQWCTLCHADLRPAPEPVAQELPVADLSAAPAEQAPTSYDPLTDPLLGDVAPASTPALTPVTSGKHARHAAPAHAAGEATPADGSVRPTLGEREIEAMIAELAAQTDPPLGGLAGRFDSRSAKVLLAVGVCLGAMGCLLVGAVVLASIFG